MTTRDDKPLLNDILDAVDSALLLVAPDGVVVLANSAAEELLGLGASELIDRLLHESVQFTDAGGPIPTDRLPWIRAPREAETAAALVTVHPGGQAVDIRVRAEPVSDDGTLGTIVTLREEVATVVQTLRDELAHSTLLQEVAVVSTSSPDLRVVCTRVLKALARHLGLAAGDIRVVSADGDRLRVVAAHGYPEEMLRLIADVPANASDTPPQLVFREGRVLTQADDTPQRRVMLAQGEQHHDLRVIVLPVEFRKRTVGVLSLAFLGERPFTEEEHGLFHAIAHTIGQAIETSRLLDAEKEARQQSLAELEISNLLLEAADRLSQPLELDGVCDALAEVLQRLVGRSRVVVALYSERQNRMEVCSVSGVRRTSVGESVSLERLTPEFFEMLADGRPRVITRESPELPPDQQELATSEDTRLGLIVPLRSHERLLGIVNIDEPGSDRPFSEREMRLAESVASHAAALIENARIYQSEHHIAETLQETLLLMPVHVPGVRFGTLYKSATAAARVGGDFYDLFEVGPGRVALVVGDVSGKGLDAASVTALARNAIRIHSSEDPRPSAVMQRTSEALRRFTSPETFVTAFFGVLDIHTGALTYVSAGHPEGMILGKGGRVTMLGGESPLLGAFEGIDYAERVTTVAPTDAIFVYTDGVTEARRGRELYGVERLAEFLGSLRDNEPETLPQMVFSAVEAFAQGSLRDDVAMLAVRRDVP